MTAAVCHDDTMIAHARRRGPVTVTQCHVVVAVGTLVCWRPCKTRTGSNGQPITRSIYVAVVERANGSRRTYDLNRYDVEPT